MLKLLTVAAMLMAAAPASAACYGSGAYRTCTDSSGNTYSTQTYGNQSFTTGRNSRTGSSWSSNTLDTGSGSYTTGRAANGNSWNLNRQDLGNGMSTYSGRNSQGRSISGVCTQFGCD